MQKLGYTRFLISILFLFLLTQLSYAQYFSVGNDPAGIRWQQINKSNYRFIFPAEHAGSAKAMAGLIDDHLVNIGASLEHLPRKFPLMLHSYSTISNGWTIWAPRRVELYPREPLYGAAEQYSDHLLIHEMRHVVQMDKLNTGITKAASYILGDQAVAAVVGLHMPNWLAEGDAVLTETLLTESGRGRMAYFQQALRALWLEEGMASYDKAILGSYKDYIPNYYVVGYDLVSMGRMLGGPLFWSKAIDRIGRKPFMISNLSRFIKSETGYNTEGLYDKTRSWFTNYWKNQPMISLNSPKIILDEAPADYTNYVKYQYESDTTGICLRKSIGDIPALIRLSRSGKETILTYPGYIDGSSFTYADGRIIWAEYISDTRWENRSFSDLFVYSIATGKKSRLSKRQRFFDPDLNAGGDRLVCVEYLPGHTNSLVILDSWSGDVLSSFSPPDGEAFMQPSWDTEGNIWVLTHSRAGKKLYRIHPAGEKKDLIYNFGIREVFYPAGVGEEVFFIAPSGAVNAVYSLNIISKQLNLISTDKFGINYLNSTDDKLFASVYRTSGYLPAQLFADSTRMQLSEIPVLNEAVTPLLERAKGEENIQHTIVDKPQNIKPYRKYFHLLKFHSWAPVSVNTHSYQVKPGVMLMSQNDLSTLALSTGIEYAYNQKRLEYYLSGDYTGWYPKLNLSARTYHDNGQLVVGPADTLMNTSYQYYQVSANLSVPLSFSSGRWIRGIIPYINLNYSLYNGERSEPAKSIYYKDLYYLGAGVKNYFYCRMSARDLYPKLGIVGSLSTIAMASDETRLGKTYLYANFQSYLPGLFKNHSTRFYIGGFLANEWPMPGQTPLVIPRGLYSDFSKYNLSTRLDYAFPFMYPDWKLGSLLYVKRLKSNLFVDAAKRMSPDHELFLSAGVDLTSDFHLLRIGVELDAGVRMIYNVIDEKMDFELLFNYSIR